MRERLQRIRLMASDVDGVLTDGGMYYTDDGDAMKRFNTRDGMGVARLRAIGVPTVLITSEDSDIVRSRARKLGIEHCHVGVVDKAALLPALCQEFDVTSEEIAYIGDDINDLGLLRLVGLSAAPADAEPAVRAVATYVCRRRGGAGAFREIAELIVEESSRAARS